MSVANLEVRSGLHSLDIPSPSLRELTEHPDRFMPPGYGKAIMLDPGLWEHIGHMMPYYSILSHAGFDCYIGNPLNIGFVEGDIAMMRRSTGRHHHEGHLSVVGHSMGGVEGEKFAARYAEKYGIDKVFKVGSPYMPLLEEGVGDNVEMFYVYGKKDIVAPKPSRKHSKGDPRVLEVDADHMSLLVNTQAIIYIGRNAAPAAASLN